MTDRPILFSAPMVQALLDGRKTQTRRVLTRARVFGTPEQKPYTLTGDHLARALQNAAGFQHLGEDGWFWEGDAFEWQAPAERTRWLAHVGYAPGDRLWVKETWRTNKVADELPPRLLSGEGRVWFEADRDNCDAHGRIRQSIFMPRWASRLTLTVTDVRIEQLQAISDEDALAEGIQTTPDGSIFHVEHDHHAAVPATSFMGLWTSINGTESWLSNPWVVAISFTVEQRNIDHG